jgi:hypothetical protein
VATTWGYKDDSGSWTEADPFATTSGNSSSSAADEAAGFPLETYKKAAGVAYEFSKKKLEDTRAQQEALAAQKQQYSQEDEARDYLQAQRAYKY